MFNVRNVRPCPRSLPVSFGGDTKNGWSLLSGAYAGRSKISTHGLKFAEKYTRSCYHYPFHMCPPSFLVHCFILTYYPSCPLSSLPFPSLPIDLFHPLHIHYPSFSSSLHPLPSFPMVRSTLCLPGSRDGDW